MFKVGDRVRLTDKCRYLEKFFGFKSGDIGVIMDDGYQESLAVVMENPKNGFTYLWCDDSELEYAEKTPPQKITQNGYEYELIGPVKPEWLVDGAWVVRKDNGETHQINQKSENSFSATSSLSRVTGLTAKRVAEEYRPHEPKDWKWGDWAMYDGKRVFVMAGVDEHGHISVSHPDIYPLGYDQAQRNFLSVSGESLTPTF